jgi:Asp-tRNA(Asn)/Glu-tRNA(Gln) amidotransferase B subunit
VRGFLVGQVMKATRGRANPQVVGEVLDRLLAKG